MHLRPITKDVKNSELFPRHSEGNNNLYFKNNLNFIKMKNEKKFKFDAKQAELINKSFNEFKNDTVKAIAANNTVGGLLAVKHSKLTWDRTAASLY